MGLEGLRSCGGEGPKPKGEGAEAVRSGAAEGLREGEQLVHFARRFAFLFIITGQGQAELWRQLDNLLLSTWGIAGLGWTGLDWPTRRQLSPAANWNRTGVELIMTWTMGVLEVNPNFRTKGIHHLLFSLCNELGYPWIVGEQ
ncbi:unnamed protein product [Calypogeia fissa]